MGKLFISLVIVSQILAILTLILLGVTFGGFAWDSSMNQFNFHPFLMVLGMVILNGEGILVYRLFPKISKPTVKIIHLTVQGTIIVMGGVALKAVFAYYNSNSYKANVLVNMVHSWVGFCTYLMFGLQWICGFLIFFFPKLFEDYRSIFMPFHRYFGVAIFALAVVSATSGIQEKTTPSDKEFSPRQLIGNFLGITIVAFALVVGFLVTNRDYRRTKAADDEKTPLTMDQTNNNTAFIYSFPQLTQDPTNL